MSERGLDRDYVAVMERHAHEEAEEEARARTSERALPVCGGTRGEEVKTKKRKHL